MCGRCNCCPGLWQKIKPQLGVNGLDPADPTSGYKLAKRIVVYMSLVMFIIFNLVCLILFFGVGGGVAGKKWYLVFLPYQMFLIMIFFGIGTIHLIQKAGVPCPMRVRGIVFYPQNSVHQAAAKVDIEKGSEAIKAQETQIVTLYEKASTMPVHMAKQGWTLQKPIQN